LDKGKKEEKKEDKKDSKASAGTKEPPKEPVKEPSSKKKWDMYKIILIKCSRFYFIVFKNSWSTNSIYFNENNIFIIDANLKYNWEDIWYRIIQIEEFFEFS